MLHLSADALIAACTHVPLPWCEPDTMPVVHLCRLIRKTELQMRRAGLPTLQPRPVSSPAALEAEGVQQVAAGGAGSRADLLLQRSSVSSRVQRAAGAGWPLSKAVTPTAQARLGLAALFHLSDALTSLPDSLMHEDFSGSSMELGLSLDPQRQPQLLQNEAPEQYLPLAVVPAFAIPLQVQGGTADAAKPRFTRQHPSQLHSIGQDAPRGSSAHDWTGGWQVEGPAPQGGGAGEVHISTTQPVQKVLLQPLPAPNWPLVQRAPWGSGRDSTPLTNNGPLPSFVSTGHTGVDRTIRIRQLSLSQRRKKEAAASGPGSESRGASARPPHWLSSAPSSQQQHTMAQWPGSAGSPTPTPWVPNALWYELGPTPGPLLPSQPAPPAASPPVRPAMPSATDQAPHGDPSPPLSPTLHLVVKPDSGSSGPTAASASDSATSDAHTLSGRGSRGSSPIRKKGQRR